MPNSKKSIGIKIHDMHHGLCQSTGAIIETELDLLKNLGAAIQIATTIKDHEIINDLTAIYPDSKDLVASTAAARLNGLAAGYGTVDNIQDWLTDFGLSEKANTRILEIVDRGIRSGCAIL